MVIRTECLSLIIPIWKVVKVLGLTKTFSLLHLEGADPVSVHDDFLLRVGAMNQETIAMMLSYWEHAGLKLTRCAQGVKQWADVCVVDQFSGPTLPCPWLAWDAEKSMVEYIDDRSRSESSADDERFQFENMGGVEIELDFNEVFAFLEKTSSQVTWKWRGTLSEISQKIQNLPTLPSKYAVLRMTLPHTLTTGSVQELCSLCNRVSGDDCGISLGVRFTTNPGLEVAFTQFL